MARQDEVTTDINQVIKELKRMGSEAAYVWKEFRAGTMDRGTLDSAANALGKESRVWLGITANHMFLEDRERRLSGMGGMWQQQEQPSSRSLEDSADLSDAATAR